jgi:hypothetical protein
VASAGEVRAAITGFLTDLDDLDDATRARIPDRSVSVLVHDLGTVFHSRFQSGRLEPVAEVDAGEDPATDLRLVMSSDELLALIAGELSFPAAWATGKIRVHARLAVLLDLRRFL